MDEIKVKIGGKEHKVKVEETPEGKLRVHHEGEVFELEPGQSSIPASSLGKGEKTENIVVAPLPGIVHAVEVKKGEHVKKGQLILTLVAMKMENDVVAPKEGKIKAIAVKKGQTVNRGEVLIEIE
jgi:glutaconyl-CoA/methylmalonyl-CoA decarboxylase subunit gamma